MQIDRAKIKGFSPKRFCALLILSCLCALSSCLDVAPRYKPTKLKMTDRWDKDGVLQPAHPDDGDKVRPDWWKGFGDPLLDKLEDQAMQLNPDLQVDAEEILQARDLAMEAKSRIYPQAGGNSGGGINKSSPHRLWRGAGSLGPTYMSNQLYAGTATWEPDFWSAISNKNRIEKQKVQERVADYASLRLSIQAELASDYIELRGLDAQYAVYQDSIKYYTTAVEITKTRLAASISPGMDVSRAEAQLYATQALQTDVRIQREILEHAIAILVNQAPVSFHVPQTSDLNFILPRLPLAIPSVLLERRPDVAASERSMAEANRAIGVSRAAFYPHVTIDAASGFMDHGFDLASLSNTMYRYGVQAILPFFQGGLRRAEVQRTWSQYREREDAYRSVILDALKEVEDDTTQVHHLGNESIQEKEAVDAALRTQNMTMALYTDGLTNYLDVVVAQVAALQARITLVQVLTREIVARVQLVRALGGGWSHSELPKGNKVIMPFGPTDYSHLRHAAPINGIQTKKGPSSYDITGQTWNNKKVAPSLDSNHRSQ